MNLDYAIFSSAAIVEPSGVFGILGGGLEWITAKSWPAMTPSLALLARFSFDREECGREFPCFVKVAAPDETLSVQDQVVILRPVAGTRHPELTSSFIALYRYQDFYFQKPGFHRFGFFINDVQVGEARLEAVQG